MKTSMGHTDITHFPIPNHTSDQIFEAIGINLKKSPVESILYYYSFGILNHYGYKRELKGKSTRDIISSIKSYTFSDLQKLKYPITDEMFETHVKEALEGRLDVFDRYSILTLLKSTQEATVAIQKASRH